MRRMISRGDSSKRLSPFSVVLSCYTSAAQLDVRFVLTVNVYGRDEANRYFAYAMTAYAAGAAMVAINIMPNENVGHCKT